VETGHRFMTKKIVIKKNNTIRFLENIKDLDLSIQFSLNGFSFCITDNSTKENVYFSEFSFEEKQSSPEELLKKVEEIFNSEIHLQKDFSSINAIYQNHLFAIVPNKYFKEENCKDYLNFNIKTLATDFIAYDDIEAIEAKNIYVPYVNINNYLYQNFGEFEYKHHLTVYIQKLLKNTTSEEKTAYINVAKDHFDLVVIEHKKLFFSNSFSFLSKEDFMYYLLFSFEQLKIDTEKIKVYFTGAILLESDLYKIAYKYIRDCNFLESNNPIFKELNTPKHTNYILLGT